MKSAIYSESQIRAVEQAAIEKGISGELMMQRAGIFIFEQVKAHFPTVEKLLILCGGGNNGGDGYIVAQQAVKHGMPTAIRYLSAPDHLKDEALHAYRLALEENENPDIAPFDENELLNYDLIVDAIVGIGLKNECRDDVVSAIDWINYQDKPVISVDIPSGLNADTGMPMPVSVIADTTITFIGLKKGLVTAQAADFCGELLVHDLGLAPSLFKHEPPAAEIIQPTRYASFLSPRKRTSHKGNFGHTLIIGGNDGMSGAPLLSALGAARAGSGLVSIATHPEHAAYLNIHQPEIMCHGVRHRKDLEPLIEKASVIVLGPGLGQDKWSQELFHHTLKHFNRTLIIDADGLNLLAEAPQKRENWILTPHPGEAARLLNQPRETINQDRWLAAKLLQARYHGVTLLKGAGSIIRNDEHFFVCTDGNPGMSSGGMGDLLSGIMAGFIAQGITLNEAACMAVSLHAKAADMTAKKEGERGMLATDILTSLRKLINP